MQKNQFVSQLRNKQFRDSVPLSSLAKLNDEEVIDLFNTCYCCPRKILTPEDLNLAIELAKSAGHFFLLMEAIMQGYLTEN